MFNKVLFFPHDNSIGPYFEISHILCEFIKISLSLPLVLLLCLDFKPIPSLAIG